MEKEEEVIKFLEYIVEIDNQIENGKEENLKKKMSKEKFDWIMSLCFENLRYVRKDTIPNEKEFRIRITPEGLTFLNRYHNKKKEENNTKTMLFLTSIIVLTTIANFFNEIGFGKLPLVIAYTIVASILIIYFKKAKVITL